MNHLSVTGNPNPALLNINKTNNNIAWDDKLKLNASPEDLEKHRLQMAVATRKSQLKAILAPTFKRPKQNLATAAQSVPVQVVTDRNSEKTLLLNYSERKVTLPVELDLAKELEAKVLTELNDKEIELTEGKRQNLTKLLPDSTKGRIPHKFENGVQCTLEVTADVTEEEDEFVTNNLRVSLYFPFLFTFDKNDESVLLVRLKTARYTTVLKLNAATAGQDLYDWFNKKNNVGIYEWLLTATTYKKIKRVPASNKAGNFLSDEDKDKLKELTSK